MALEDEEIEYTPPTPVEVARRALILSAVVCRANLEAYRDEDYRQEAKEDMDEWLDELELWPHLEPDEREIMHAPFGKISRSLEIDGTWYAEGLAILAWALRRSEFPPHDKKVDPIAVTNALDFLSPDAADLLAFPRLRSKKKRQAVREWFYDVHCTLRGFLYHGGDGHLATWIGEYLNILGIDPKEVMTEDCYLLFRGRRLQHAETDELENWEWIIRERHRAAIWLVGEDPLYTEISVDT